MSVPNNSESAPGGLDWPGLLAWSSKYHDGTKPSEFTMMTKEDRDFIQSAMEAAFSQIEDMNKTLQEGLKKLEEAGHDGENSNNNTEQKLVALEVIDRCVDDPDCARNLGKFGGIRILLQNAVGIVNNLNNNLETVPESSDALPAERYTPHPEVVIKCCEILSLMLANNETLQESAVNYYKALDYLVLENGGEGIATDSAAVKARLALVASIVRGHPALEERFINSPYNGLSWLCFHFEKLMNNSTNSTNLDQKLNSEQRKIQEKIALFIRHLVLEKVERCNAKVNTSAGSIEITIGTMLVDKFLIPAYREIATLDSSDSNSNSDSESPFSIQYLEILSMAGAIIVGATHEDPIIKSKLKDELHVSVKKRMENLVRRGGGNAEFTELHAVEMDGLKGILSFTGKL